MTALRTFGIIFIFCCTAIAWLILGAAVTKRTDDAKRSGTDAVGQLWGTEQRQRAPVFSYVVPREVAVEAPAKPPVPTPETTSPDTATYEDPESRGWPDEKPPKTTKTINEYVYVEPESSTITTDLSLEYRRKGLLWYSTYVTKFDSVYRLKNNTGEKKTFYVGFSFPATNALFDDFVFKIGDKDIDFPGNIAQGITAPVELAPGEEVDIRIGYKSPGLDRWVYSFGEGVTRVRNFTLKCHTDFAKIDFPAGCISPTKEAKNGGGWDLTWDYKNLLTGYSVGVEMPRKLDPGPTASRMAFFAPVALLFFFAVLFILSAVRSDRIQPIHPMNYFFLAASFFAFHLLFAYLADHLDVLLTFITSSAVSLLLVFVYVALMRGAKYAFFNTTLPQFLFLVLFSYAFFYPGYTGLIITVGAIVTLAVLMFGTARVDWASKFGSKKAGPAAKPPATAA